MHSFSELNWAIFGTLTWAEPHKRSDTYQAESMRRHDFTGLLTAAMVRFGVRRKHLPYYRCTEVDANGHAHLHFLVAHHPAQKFDNVNLANFIEYYWTNIFCPSNTFLKGAGTAIVRPYNQAMGLRGVDYCLKQYSRIYRDYERFEETSPSLIKLHQKL